MGERASHSLFIAPQTDRQADSGAMLERKSSVAPFHPYAASVEFPSIDFVVVFPYKAWSRLLASRTSVQSRDTSLPICPIHSSEP